jgi:aspartyl-tRNA(Asn)/glutamyl-tRNA(Gln) amidotransferase subunit A
MKPGSQLDVSRRKFVLTGLAAAAHSAFAEGYGGTGLSAPPHFVEAQRPQGSGSVPSTELTTLTLKQAAELIRRRDVSPVELTEACLARIERHDGAINAFITLGRDQALAIAREIEGELRRGRPRGPLHGVPIALKDNIDTAGMRTTAASGVFKDRVPSEDAEVVVRLKRAGAVILGKLNLHEFALGGTSAVTYFGPVHNPWALDRVAGGSSGGSAAAIAADMCFGTLGTDTGGSIRIPASLCGIVGFKPTYGRVSNRGVIPMAWTLDHVGPMCKTVEDAALMLAAIAGHDAGDPASADEPVPDYSRAVRSDTRKMRVGVARTPFFEGLNPEVAKAVEAAIEVLRALTAGVRDVDVPATGNIATVWNPEIYAYHLPWITKNPELYQPATRNLIQGAAKASAAAYAQARRDVDAVRQQVKRVFAAVDVLITPTQRGVAQPIAPGQPPAGERGAGPAPGRGGPAAAAGGGIVNTAAFDIYGLPTISVPCGFSSTGLPIGLQISGNHFAESTVLAVAHAYEQATEWHRRRPALR